ncbi:MAG: ATP-binding cassette domain-containing protein [Erysipelotrichia bacterium]|nr:ATP-binding cassette domain-containing protein [Erysipelotrichia bacterium]
MSQFELLNFSKFESLVDFFVAETGIFFPNLAAGQKPFFNGFSQWFASERSTVRNRFAMILPEPSQGLALPNPLDVLTSAMLLSKLPVDPDAVIGLMELFGLDREKLTQPVSTLSGGELLLLNYAKAYAQKKSVSGLLACNPVFWLNRARYSLWHNLVASFNDENLSVKTAILDGDPLDSSYSESFDSFASVSPMSFMVQFDRPVICFPEIQFPVYHPESRIFYNFSGSRSCVLKSPVFITGDNGVGKSVFARLLAGIFQLSSGYANVKSVHGNSSVRLLFQESISQLFAQSILEHRSNIFSIYSKGAEIANNLFLNLSQKIISKSSANCEKTSEHSLLAAKIALISERLVNPPALLLLDEPGWGLSRSDAMKLVYHTVVLSHSFGTAVAIISHQPEWHAMTASNLQLAKSAAGEIEMSYRETVSHA